MVGLFHLVSALASPALQCGDSCMPHCHRGKAEELHFKMRLTLPALMVGDNADKKGPALSSTPLDAPAPPRQPTAYSILLKLSQ